MISVKRGAISALNKNNPPHSNLATHFRVIGFIVILLSLSLIVATSGFQTYFSKERRLISAGEEIAAALNAYREASPGTAKEFPLELIDLLHDPRMLSDRKYLTALPVDPVTLKQEWGVIRNKTNQVVGVNSLSDESPTLFAKIFSFRGGTKYSDWKFMAQ